jgi:hypothetical protein
VSLKISPRSCGRSGFMRGTKQGPDAKHSGIRPLAALRQNS